MRRITRRSLVSAFALTLVSSPAIAGLSAESAVMAGNGRIVPAAVVNSGDSLINDKGLELPVTARFGFGPTNNLILLKTDNGHRLILTRDHPVITPTGVTLAQMLKPGDALITTDGPSALVTKRPAAPGKVVHFLTAMPQGEAPGPKRLFANGILVGADSTQGQIKTAPELGTAFPAQAMNQGMMAAPTFNGPQFDPMANRTAFTNVPRHFPQSMPNRFARAMPPQMPAPAPMLRTEAPAPIINPMLPPPGPYKAPGIAVPPMNLEPSDSELARANEAEAEASGGN